MAMIGHNVVPYAQDVTDRLSSDYAELLVSTSTALDKAMGMPPACENATHVADIAALMVQLRDLAARGEAHRKAEGEPYLRSKEAVDAFFFKRVKEPLDQVRKDLGGRLDLYKQQQLAEERRRREAEALAARKAQQEAERARQEAEAAARRARSEETQRLREEQARQARVQADMAEAAVETTTLATMQKPGRMVGERFEGTERSGQVTMRKTAFCMIDDAGALDLEVLRPYIKEEHLLMALRAWAKATNYAVQMPGATVGLRDATVVR